MLCWGLTVNLKIMSSHWLETLNPRLSLASGLFSSLSDSSFHKSRSRSQKCPPPSAEGGLWGTRCPLRNLWYSHGAPEWPKVRHRLWDVRVSLSCTSHLTFLKGWWGARREDKLVPQLILYSNVSFKSLFSWSLSDISMSAPNSQLQYSRMRQVHFLKSNRHTQKNKKFNFCLTVHHETNIFYTLFI